MTKRPDLPIEQEAAIEREPFMFDAAERSIDRLESLVEKFVLEERKIMFTSLLESLRGQVKDMRQRDQLKSELADRLIYANSVL